MISALAITYNEEPSIEKFIKSLSFADEIIIVDSNSTDKTVSIAKELGAKVLIRDFDVITVGARFSTIEKNLISSLGFANNQVKRISYLTDMQLARFYSNAAAFIYPSLYEGFGLPPL